MAQYLVVRAWLEEVLGTGGEPASGVHHRPGPRRASGDRQPGRHRGAGSAARGRGALQRSVSGGPSAGGLGRHRHRADCWPAPGRPSMRLSPTSCSRIARRSTALCSGPPTPRLGAQLHVLMPYSDRLREFAEWYRQLWAESLGKAQDRRGNPGESGSHAGGRGRRHRSAQSGAVVHGGAVRQGGLVHDRREFGRRRDDSRAAGSAGRPRLSAGTHPRRPAPGRAAGHCRRPLPHGPHELHSRAARPFGARAWEKRSCSSRSPRATPAPGTA